MSASDRRRLAGPDTDAGRCERVGICQVTASRYVPLFGVWVDADGYVPMRCSSWSEAIEEAERINTGERVPDLDAGEMPPF